MIFGIIKELKSPPDRRVVFAPATLKKAQGHFPGATFIVESSDVRIFSDQEYREAGFEVTDDLSDCDVLLGVKEVPIAALLPLKQYFFFSHTIKKQPYNKGLLQAILEKNITLYDHETLVDSAGNRLLGFGYYAGLVGAYNAVRAMGLLYKSFQLPKAETLKDKVALLDTLDTIELSAVKIVLTGTGRVGTGAKEILDHLGIVGVSTPDFLTKKYDHPVYVQLNPLDYNERMDGGVKTMSHFFEHAAAYQSSFMSYATVADVFIAGHFYGEGAPYLFTKEDANSPSFNIRLVADISCDIDGPVASTIRASTIANPVYGYNPKTHTEVPFGTPESIAVMAVDNLPCELPRDASMGFGTAFLEKVLPAFFNNDTENVLERARMTKGGALTQKFSYLQDYVNKQDT